MNQILKNYMKWQSMYNTASNKTRALTEVNELTQLTTLEYLQTLSVLLESDPVKGNQGKDHNKHIPKH